MDRIKKGLQFLVSLCIGALFLWLAFRNVKWSSLVHYMENMHYGWIPPFIVITLMSHYIRAERWKLLIEKDHVKVDRSVLFSGVMIAYVVNYAIPRLGEITRCVYVGRRHKISSSSLFGTVIVERAIDLLTLILLLLFVIFYVVTDPNTLKLLFGQETVHWLHHLFDLQNILYLLLIVIILFGIGYGMYLALFKMSRYFRMAKVIWTKLKYFITMLWDGLVSIRRVKNWPLFIGLTALMWFCYVLMTFIPFYMFNMVKVFHLGLFDAMTVTVIAAIGIALPSPGGMGTYHWFVKQALLVLFSVPAVTGLAYAFITYAVIFLIYMIFTPIIIFVSRYLESGKLDKVKFSSLFKKMS